MSVWKIAAVQMGCRLGDVPANREAIRGKLREAAAEGARLAVFPECILSGYSFESKEEAWPHSESIPGPTTQSLAQDCQTLNIWCAFGMLERDGQQIFNACALIGPDGSAVSYRKVHLPILGVDRFTTPGNRPFAVHDLGGLKLGMTICYDGSFPEASRVLALQGADLIVLPTNWPTGARSAVLPLAQARAIENHIYYAAVNRTGNERGFHFIGCSRIVDFSGTILTSSTGDLDEILYADIEPTKAREKQVVIIPGKYEVNRVAHRRPEMYEALLNLPAAK